MSKEVKLLNKIRRLLKRLGCPRWLHHYGPKTYEFLHHFTALLVKVQCRLSYRLVKKWLDLLGILCPSKSALQYTAKKLDSRFWERVLCLTSGQHYLIAIDSTGLTRTNPSYHYLKRIDGKTPKIPIKLSVSFDTRKKKFCAAKIRVLPAHDIKDAKYLLEKSKPKIGVADKAYSAESLYRFAKEQNILLMIPKKKNVKRGRVRNLMHKLFRTRTYHRRELVESGIGCSKRKYGSSVNSKTVRTIRTEVYSRLACHNIFGKLFLTFRTEPLCPKSI
jgi:hypothetical protein